MTDRLPSDVRRDVAEFLLRHSDTFFTARQIAEQIGEEVTRVATNIGLHYGFTKILPDGYRVVVEFDRGLDVNTYAIVRERVHR